MGGAARSGRVDLGLTHCDRFGRISETRRLRARSPSPFQCTGAPGWSRSRTGARPGVFDATVGFEAFRPVRVEGLGDDDGSTDCRACGSGGGDARPCSSRQAPPRGAPDRCEAPRPGLRPPKTAVATPLKAGGSRPPRRERKTPVTTDSRHPQRAAPNPLDRDVEAARAGHGPARRHRPHHDRGKPLFRAAAENPAPWRGPAGAFRTVRVHRGRPPDEGRGRARPRRVRRDLPRPPAPPAEHRLPDAGPGTDRRGHGTARTEEKRFPPGSGAGVRVPVPSRPGRAARHRASRARGRGLSPAAGRQGV